VKTVRGKVRHSLATNRAKMIGGGDPFYLKFWIKVTALDVGAKSLIFNLFARSDSAVTPSEKNFN